MKWNISVNITPKQKPSGMLQFLPQSASVGSQCSLLNDLPCLSLVHSPGTIRTQGLNFCPWQASSIKIDRETEWDRESMLVTYVSMVKYGLPISIVAYAMADIKKKRNTKQKQQFSCKVRAHPPI